MKIGYVRSYRIMTKRDVDHLCTDIYFLEMPDITVSCSPYDEGKLSPRSG